MTIQTPDIACGRVVYIFFVMIMAAVLLVSPALAGPRDHKAELEKTRKAIDVAEERTQALGRDMKAVEEELRALQKKMVTMTAEVQEAESELLALEEKQATLDTERDEKLARYKREREQLAAALSGMIRLSHTPAEAVVAMPGEFADTLRTAQVLQVATRSLRLEAQVLSLQLAGLEDVQKALEENRRELSERRQALGKQQAELSVQVKERSRLQEALQVRSKREQEELAKLTRRSGSLKDLMKNLESSRARTERGYETASLSPPPSRLLESGRSFAMAKGKIRLPVAGKISSFYGESKNKNETSRGITIATRSRAQVVAPFDGEVAFTGPFLDYGQMIILRHGGAYHTLLAGMERIDCVVGQKVMQGEPVGVAGTPEEKGGGQIYLELRLKNSPIDPVPWMDRRA